MSASRQTVIGVGLAFCVMAAWLGLQVYAVFFLPLNKAAVVAAPLLIAAICWLNVGLFIIAHDAMHGSLAPGRPELNRTIGRTALRLYAGFSFDKLREKHFAHHRHPGTEDDPDFNVQQPGFWRWYAGFLREYFGMTQWLILSAVTVLCLLAGAPYANLLLFWALPAILSSVQLFYFGTYRPHRVEQSAFTDDHRARSSSFGWLASLLSCYHFGYHHEHHLAPHVPWWGLPRERRRRASSR